MICFYKMTNIEVPKYHINKVPRKQLKERMLDVIKGKKRLKISPIDRRKYQ